jgi:hypothetical protein
MHHFHFIMNVLFIWMSYLSQKCCSLCKMYICTKVLQFMDQDSRLIYTLFTFTGGRRKNRTQCGLLWYKKMEVFAMSYIPKGKGVFLQHS